MALRLVQYPGFHSFVAYPRRDSSYVTDVTHEFMMSLCPHQMSPRCLVPEAFQEHKPKHLRTPPQRLLEDVDTEGWCASKLGMGPGYPGLDESKECASWSILHWISVED
jgi:hypothetical protein